MVWIAIGQCNFGSSDFKSSKMNDAGGQNRRNGLGSTPFGIIEAQKAYFDKTVIKLA